MAKQRIEESKKQMHEANAKIENAKLRFIALSKSIGKNKERFKKMEQEMLRVME